MSLRKYFVIALFFMSCMPGLQAQGPGKEIINPLLPSGADPWVTYHDGFYYYTNTMGNNLTLWKTQSLADLKTAEKTIVWTPPATGPYSHDIWAPELHFVRGKWYLYFAADAGTNDSHRIWVLENSSPNPLEGRWRMKGQMTDKTNRWAIDPTLLEDRGRLYLVWSGWEGSVNGVQSIYMARLSNPWTVVGLRVRLSTPEYPWEKVGDLTSPGRISDMPHVEVNEGPEILKHGGKIFLVYSASGCWTDYYELGMSIATSGANLMNPASWRKLDHPVFRQAPENSVYAPGHNSFFQSPDGKEDWIVYHANSAPGEGCGAHRSPRAQRFHWREDGTPDFGKPASLNDNTAPRSGVLQ